MERMRAAIDEAKSAIRKAQDDMKRYYDRQRAPAPVFKPGDKVFLDALDIQTTHPLQKFSHRRLGPFVVERRIGPMAYYLRLPHGMKQLHPVFNVVKLTPALDDPITGCKMEDHSLPIVIDGEPVTNFIRPYLHQFFDDSHGLKASLKPLKRPFDRYQSRLEAISIGRDIRQINW